MGKWLDVNAEVIYGSQTWTHYLEGDSVRYTYTGGGHIYAISLVWPGESLILERIIEGQPRAIATEQDLGSEQKTPLANNFYSDLNYFNIGD
jgi:hypothetical protein